MSGVDSDGTSALQCCHETLNSCPGAHVEGSGLNSGESNPTQPLKLYGTDDEDMKGFLMAWNSKELR